MNKILKEKIKEAFSSVLPITVIVLIASVVLTPVQLPSGTVLMFLVGAALLIVGMGFFTLGADIAMIPMGEGIGIELTKSTKIWAVILVSFVVGVIVTIAEPPLLVLGDQVPSIPKMTLVVTVAAGVGVFLVIGVLRTLFKIPFSLVLIVFYSIIFIVVSFVPDSFVPVAFDSGGVTTGPITVPFILAMGIGLTMVRSDKHSQEDSFGFVAICSIGPILAIFLLGMFFKPQSVQVDLYSFENAHYFHETIIRFITALPHYLFEVLIPIGSILICFVAFQLITKRYHRHQLGRILVGFLYTFVGLVLFLTGVNVGFIPVGHLFGSQLAESEISWLLVPMGVLFGYFIVAAEPAVQVHNKQIEEISSGAITRKMMNRGLAIGMALALGLTMLRILLKIPIMWILVPGYIFALVLTFFVPKIFTGIAFDAGGVCSGPMTSTFLLPFAMGVCEGIGGDLMTDAFGIVAIVALTPLVVVQLMGLVYQFKAKEAAAITKLQTETIAKEDGAIDWGKITVFEVSSPHERVHPANDTAKAAKNKV